nr:hypothetical protein [Burkholderiaceae bacterium]
AAPLRRLLDEVAPRAAVLTVAASRTPDGGSLTLVADRTPDGSREHFIWGVTAAMLRNLYRFLAA